MSPTGAQGWVEELGVPSYATSASGVAVGPTGSVFVTGASAGNLALGNSGSGAAAASLAAAGLAAGLAAAAFGALRGAGFLTEPFGGIKNNWL